MRVNPNIASDILADMQQSQATLNTALEEVATGKRVTKPSDDPVASSSMVQNTIATANVDQYTKNVSSELSMVQTADSALSSVVSSLTRAVSLGTEGANGTTNASNLQAIANEVQGILSSVVALANTSYSGTYLFSGTETTTAPYTADSASSSGYTYNGNGGVNSVAIGDDATIQVNLPGSQLFSNSSANVLGSLSSLVTALKSGNASDIESATSAVSGALNYVDQQRVFYGNAASQLDSQETYLSQEKVNLTSQEDSLIAVDESQAATLLTQAETANSAAAAAAAKVLPETILNYLATPS
ncbi:MAG: flagellar hook-associated protein FlgL [Terracidiphilus sp.]|jgi:flagellar hook-associated protein 3 FlgL